MFHLNRWVKCGLLFSGTLIDVVEECTVIADDDINMLSA